MVQAFPEIFSPILGDMAEIVLHDWLQLSQRHLKTTTVAMVETTMVGFLMVSPKIIVNHQDERWFWQALRQHFGWFNSIRYLITFAFNDNDHRTKQNELYIEMIAVDPTWQGHGIGQLLINQAEILAQTRPVSNISLSVLVDNTAALQFYQQCGFKIIGIEHQHWLQRLFGSAQYYAMAKRLKLV